MISSKAQVARFLAQSHYRVEPGIRDIFALVGPPEIEALPGTPIKLLEVNEETLACGVMPLSFAPTDKIPFPSLIVEVTPDEYRRIRAKELPLPSQWTIGERYSESSN